MQYSLLISASPRLLLRVGADPDIVNTNGKTALHIAKERGEREMIHMVSGKLMKNVFFFYSFPFFTHVKSFISTYLIIGRNSDMTIYIKEIFKIYL